MPRTTSTSPNSLSLAFIEGLYADFLQDPDSVEPEWRDYFERQAAAGNGTADWKPGPSFRSASLFNPRGGRGGNGKSATATAVSQAAALQDRVDQLIRDYRVRGHMAAETNPLGLPRPRQPELDLDFYGLTEADLDRRFSIDTIPGGDTLTLREIIERLHNTYCRSIGVQFMHIDDLDVRHWLQDGWKRPRTACSSAAQEQLRILDAADRRRDLRGVHPEEVRRRQELFAGRRREPDSAVGPGHRKGRRAGGRRDRDGHGPPRPAQRAGQHHGQDARRRSSASSRTSTPSCTGTAAT